MRGPQRVALRGLLRLVVLSAPAYVVLSLVNAGDRALFWTDERSVLGGDPAGAAALGAPLPGTRVELQGHLAYALPDPPAWLWLLSLLPGLLLTLAMSVVALLLLRMMTETYAGAPFGRSAAPRLRRVAGVVALAAVSVPLVEAGYVHALTTRVLPAEAPSVLQAWDYSSDTLPWLAVSLLVLCVAQAFDIGARLADDVEGLV